MGNSYTAETMVAQHHRGVLRSMRDRHRQLLDGPRRTDDQVRLLRGQWAALDWALEQTKPVDKPDYDGETNDDHS